MLLLGHLPREPGVARHPAGARTACSPSASSSRFLGYGLFMVGPIRTFFEFAQKGDARRWSAPARRSRSSSERPPWRDPADPRSPSTAARALHDVASGFTVEPGHPHRRRECRARAERGPRRPARPLPARRHRARRRGRRRRRSRAAPPAARGPSASAGAPGSPPATRSAATPRVGRHASAASTSPHARLDDVRRQVLVSDTASGLFAGTLQDAIDPHGRLTREQAEEALRVASAEDVYDALPEGWQGQLDERGRGLSGGQRQRVVLARAAGRRRPGPGAGRADLRGRRPHRGPHRRARVASPPRPHDRGLHRLAPVAAPRRPRRAPPRRPVVAEGEPRRPAGRRRGLPPRGRPASLDEEEPVR